MQRTVLAAVSRRLLWLAAVVIASLVAAPFAAADTRTEKEAMTLRKKAIEEDNLNVNYAAAIKKLESAIAKCGSDRCSPAVKAGLLRDRGAMKVLNGSVDEGKNDFSQALALDGSLELDAAYKNPTMESLWNQAKKAGGGGGGGAATGGGGAAGGGGGGKTSQPSGDFAHTAPPEAQTRTPLALYVEYSGGEELKRVVIKYKSASMSEWKSVNLTKVGDGYGGLIPCKDAVQGTIQYYIQGFNAQNDAVATSGTRSKPFSVPVKDEITGAVPALPNQDPPQQCGEMATAECPPDFPGCNTPKKAGGEDCDKNRECKSNSCVGGKCIEKKSGGDDCEADDDCTSGSCSSNKCAAAKKDAGDDCESDDECSSGTCKTGKCVGGGGGPAGPYSKIWIGFAGQVDSYSVPSSTNVCALNSTGKLPLNKAGYRCVTNAGASFPADAGTNGDITNGGSVPGGFKVGNIRLLASIDYALTPNILLGGRLGYVLNTNTASGGSAAPFPPVHVEARLSYLFGKSPLSGGIAPLVLVGAGLGEFDASSTTKVTLSTQTTTVTENAWIMSGPLFLSGGGGVRIGFSSRVALTGILKVEAGLGGPAGSLIGVAPEIGMQFGL